VNFPFFTAQKARRDLPFCRRDPAQPAILSYLHCLRRNALSRAF
jgi:hypothetical protein